MFSLHACSCYFVVVMAYFVTFWGPKSLIFTPCPVVLSRNIVLLITVKLTEKHLWYSFEIYTQYKLIYSGLFEYSFVRFYTKESF
jgi:hypothetical protein